MGMESWKVRAASNDGWMGAFMVIDGADAGE